MEELDDIMDKDFDKLVSKDSSLTVGPIGGDIIKKLPNGQDFNIAMIPGWFELDADKQYICEQYLASNLQRTLTCINAGIRPSRFDSLLEQDEVFAEVISILQSLFYEGLESVHITEAFGNSKIRASVLKAKHASGGWREEKAPVTNNTLIVKDLSLSELLANKSTHVGGQLQSD
jgi:hypothetical protein